MRLPNIAEPLVTGATARPSRQTRRKALRTRAKTGYREPAALEPELAPLPRSQSLAKPPTGVVSLIKSWFSRLVPRRTNRRTAVSQDALAEQMVALRGELAMVQGRLDRMIAAVSRR